MTPRDRPAAPADPPAPTRTPFGDALEPTSLVPLPPDDEPVAESAACPFCGGVVTPADERCPRCAAKVVPPGAKPMEALRSNARTVYVLQALAVVCGVTAIPGLLIAYANRGSARDTWLDSHYEWQVDTFWGMFWFWLVAFAVGAVGDYTLGKGLLGHGPALLVAFAGIAWYINRVVKGWSRLSDGDPVTDY
jgi:uncharacterized membrane protein